VTDVLIHYNIPIEVAHELMDLHNQFTFGASGEGDRLDVRIDRTSRVRRKSEYSLVTMETVLAAMHGDVIWANGMEGGPWNPENGIK